MLRLHSREFLRKSEHASTCKKLCEHEQASTHLTFASSSSKCQFFLRPLSIWMGRSDTPWYVELEMLFLHCHYTHAIRHSMICIIILENATIEKWKPAILRVVWVSYNAKDSQWTFGTLYWSKEVREMLFFLSKFSKSWGRSYVIRFCLISPFQLRALVKDF